MIDIVSACTARRYDNESVNGSHRTDNCSCKGYYYHCYWWWTICRKSATPILTDVCLMLPK